MEMIIIIFLSYYIKGLAKLQRSVLQNIKWKEITKR